MPGVTNATAYTNISLPEWGVPKDTCTPGGVRILEGTGTWLASSGALPADATVAVLADVSQRDVDSGNALVRGMGRNLTVRVDATLFNTLDPEGDAIPVCHSSITDADLVAATEQRMHVVPYPTDLERATSLLERLIGVGTAGPLAPMGPPAVGSGGKLSGAIGPLKLFSQNLFYSFASGISYAWDRATASELYELLSWQQYLRAVTDMNGNKATKNAWLLRALLRMLESESPDGVHVADTMFLFGHDGNLDGLATLLGLRWTIPPYLGSGELVPTPPGSGLRFELEPATGVLEVSFVYPVYTAAGGGINVTGVLEASPVTSATAEPPPRSLVELQGRVIQGLARNDDAHRCYCTMVPDSMVWRFACEGMES